MAFIIYSLKQSAPVARWDGRLSDLSIRDGEVAIPCQDGADPNDPKWSIEAAAYEAKYSLDIARDRALERIDRFASEARGRHITAGVGQEATYQLKAEEAAAYIAAGRPADDSAYPLLAAEAMATGATASDVADAVQLMRQQWVQLAAYIEGVRMGGKVAVQAATELSVIKIAVAQAEQALDGV